MQHEQRSAGYRTRVSFLPSYQALAYVFRCLMRFTGRSFRPQRVQENAIVFCLHCSRWEAVFLVVSFIFFFLTFHVLSLTFDNRVATYYVVHTLKIITPSEKSMIERIEHILPA